MGSLAPDATLTASTAPRPSLLKLPDGRAEELAGEFASAKPFPFIVFDNALDLSPAQVDESFPDADWPHWLRHAGKYQRNKHQASDLELLPSLLRQIVDEMCAPRFLSFLENVTGIKALLVDPYLNGGGLHFSGPGGILAPHTDFHKLWQLNAYRRLNVILYLNDEWEEGWGGLLKLYKKGSDEPEQAIVPLFGRMVVFRTDAESVHGFPDPIAEGKWRKSIALYYYTAKDTEVWSGDGTTYWQQHGKSENAVRAARLGAYKVLLKASETFGRLAHRANPDA